MTSRYLLPFLLAAAPLAAQAPTTPPTLDAPARRAVVDSLAATLVRLYVDADTGRMIAARLRTRLTSGAYDQVTDVRRFSEALTADLRSVNGDGHLSVAFSGAGTSAPQPQRDPRREHWGLGRVEILAGNIGYMKVNAFEGSPAAIAATAAALRYLEGTDAVIFDFRGMGGGSGEQSNYLLSHFTSADTAPSLVVADRSRGTRTTRYTLAHVPGLRRPTTPVWILVDRGTASAGEDFAFVLQQLGRARVVGDRTAGAGHNNTFVPVGQGFVASISYTRVSDPRTGREWERVGVTPDMKVAPREALTAAHAAALDSLQRLEGDANFRATLKAARDGVLAAANPYKAAVATLQGYAGTYEGGRVVAVEDGVLTLRRNAGRPPHAFVATSDSTFILDGVLPVSFEQAADGVRMVQRPGNGSPQVIKRVGPVSEELAP